MTITIEEIQKQISDLQTLLNTMKDPTLEISRNFTGQYFKPYQGKQYRRMESDGVAIWEYYVEARKDWEILNKQESKKLEDLFVKTFVPVVEEPEEKEK